MMNMQSVMKQAQKLQKQTGGACIGKPPVISYPILSSPSSGGFRI